MGMWSLNIPSSDEYKDAYDSFFAYYNSLECNDDLGKKAYQIAKKIYSDSLDDNYVKASTAFALLKALHKIGFPYALNPQEKEKLLQNDQAGLISLGLSSKDLLKRGKIAYRFLNNLNKPPKQIIYPKKPKLDFQKGDVIVRKTIKGDYLYAVCLEADFAKKELLWALMLESSELEDGKTLLNKKPVVVGWYDGVCKKYTKMFEYPDEIQKIRGIKPSFKLSVTKNNLNCAKNIYIAFDPKRFYCSWWESELIYLYQKFPIFEYEFKITDDGSILCNAFTKTLLNDIYLPRAKKQDYIYLADYIH